MVAKAFENRTNWSGFQASAKNKMADHSKTGHKSTIKTGLVRFSDG
jgi:hypothetical protein